MEKQFLEKCLADGMSLPQIGKLVGRSPGTVGYHVRKHGLKANGAERYAPLGGIVEDVLEIMVEDGLSLRDMAEQLECSVWTVRYWLDRYGLQTDRSYRRELKESRPKSARLRCKRHGLSDFVLEGRGYYRCKRCRAEAVAERRRVVKRMLIEEAGGGCQICGYNRYAGALQFHHLDPGEKKFTLSVRGVTRSITKLRAEAAKCVLLCANCHAEVEGGVVAVRATGPSSAAEIRATPPTGFEPVRLD